ncbi:MAG: aminotransferase class I/II-fold pyridoxal phosphate-dependent enzyme, partial [Lutispora sp.]|nr:aminotransferase class I/II-fold pyridoxal phosphate-dependent enzyme [Lutispora sp.]
AVTYNQDIYQKVRELQQPWNVNTAAVIAGNTVFNDNNYIYKSKIWIKEERDFIYKGLSLVKGLCVYPSKSNFHLLKLTYDDMDSYKLKNELVNHRILIRTPDGFSFLTPRHFRLAVLNRLANTSLLSALYSLLGREL